MAIAASLEVSEGCAKKVVDPWAMTPRPHRAPWRVPPALLLSENRDKSMVPP
jgi:hypothetical protein